MLLQMNELLTGIDQIYEDIQQGNISDAMGEYIKFIDRFQIQLVKIENTLPQELLSEKMPPLNDILKQILQLFVEKDYYGISDILLFELKPALEEITN